MRNIELLWNQHQAAFVLALAVLIVLLTHRLWMASAPQKKRSTGRTIYKAPPKCNESFWQVLRAFFSPQAPFFLLKVVREKGRVVELPLAPPGQRFFLVGDHVLARRVLDDPKSSKYRPIYALLEALTLGENFFSREGDRAKHVRKGVAPFFASSSISKITSTIIQECLQDWMRDTLDPAVEHGIPIDVAAEMQQITLQLYLQGWFWLSAVKKRNRHGPPCIENWF